MILSKEDYTDPFKSYAFDKFRPFGDGVRIGSYGAAGHAAISANLSDLCKRYSVDEEPARKLNYPDGSILLLQIRRNERATEIYLDESAYAHFMRWVSEVQK